MNDKHFTPSTRGHGPPHGVFARVVTIAVLAAALSSGPVSARSTTPAPSPTTTAWTAQDPPPPPKIPHIDITLFGKKLHFELDVDMLGFVIILALASLSLTAILLALLSRRRARQVRGGLPGAAGGDRPAQARRGRSQRAQLRSRAPSRRTDRAARSREQGARDVAATRVARPARAASRDRGFSRDPRRGVRGRRSPTRGCDYLENDPRQHATEWAG